MNYLYFCLSFLFCSAVCCGTFLFCVRVLFLCKNQKIDPVYVAKTPKEISVKKRIEKDEIIKKILENG